MLRSDPFIAAALVHQGMFPCAPFNPSYAVSTRLLELYQNLFCRCPHLTRQSFIKGGCVIHYLFCSRAKNWHYISYPTNHIITPSSRLPLIYTWMCLKKFDRVLVTLRRDQPLWCVKNTCPACSYRLHHEKDLKLKIIIAMDGNNSLKHLWRDGGAKDETDVRLSQCALPDSRTAPGDYYVMHAKVDEWEKNVIKKKNPRLGSVSLCHSLFTVH